MQIRFNASPNRFKNSGFENNQKAQTRFGNAQQDYINQLIQSPTEQAFQDAFHKNPGSLTLALTQAGERLNKPNQIFLLKASEFLLDKSIEMQQLFNELVIDTSRSIREDRRN